MKKVIIKNWTERSEDFIGTDQEFSGENLEVSDGYHTFD